MQRSGVSRLTAVLAVLHLYSGQGQAINVANAFVPYPGYTGVLSGSGFVTIVEDSSSPTIGQNISWSLLGMADPLCNGTVPSVPNACGVHIHVGTSCSNASTIGGHWYNSPTVSADPWTSVTYTYNTTGSAVRVGTGYPNILASSRVVVVHDSTGVRIACSPFAQAFLVASQFTAYPGYNGSLITTGSVTLVEDRTSGVVGQITSWSLAGGDTSCTRLISGVPNACGVHVHSGTSCSTASGHYWNSSVVAADPWATVPYLITPSMTMTGSGVLVVTGIPNTGLSDRVVVVHDSTGRRIACSPLIAVSPATTTAAPSGLISSAWTRFLGPLALLLMLIALEK